MQDARHRTEERNRLAAELRKRRQQRARGHEWTDEEVAEMEKGDEGFNTWLEELEALQRLVGP